MKPNKKALGIDPATADLFWILLIAVSVRLFYYAVLFNTAYVDTPTYINYRGELFKGQLDSFRTPVYPYFIKLIQLFRPHDLINAITRTQIAISFLTLIVFYQILVYAFKSRKVIFAAAVAYAVMLPVINFDKVVLTESLAVCFMVGFIGLLANYLQRPGSLKAVLLSLFVFAAIMLRPSFLLLLPIMMAFWLLRWWLVQPERRICLAGFVSSVMVMLLVAGYCRLNEKQNSFNGLSTVTNLNQLDILVYAGIYEKGNDPELTRAITNDLKMPQKSGGHWDMLADISTRYRPDRIQRFININVRNQYKAYLYYKYTTLINLQDTNMLTYYATHRKGFLPDRFKELEKLFCLTFNIVFVLLLVDLVRIITQWRRSRQAPWFKMLVWAIIVGQLSVAIIGAQGEYPRLVVAAIPAILILMFSYADALPQRSA